MNKVKGFSLIELLLVVAIAASIFVVVAPFSLNLYRTQLLEDSRSNLIDALQRARHYAVLQKNDSAFGVHFDSDTNQYTLFQGNDFDGPGRDTSQDEDPVAIIEDITISGLTDIVFSKLTGTTTAATTTLTYGNFSKQFLVQESGGISKIDNITVGGGVVVPEFSPADISGLKIWLKADAIVGLSDGDSVTTWADSSSQETDATCGSCPVYKTNILNTEPVVRFDGSSNTMTFSDISDTRTIFVVFNDLGGGDYAHLLGGVTAPGQITFHGHTAGSAVVIGTTWAHPNVNNGEAWVDGVTTAVGSVPKTSSYQILSFITSDNVNVSGLAYAQMAGRYWNGDFAELIIYNTVLSESDRIDVETYLSNKYDITLP